MPVYSHSQLSTYEECPLKFKLCYRDKIKRDREGIEAFLGSMVHEALRKCYDDARRSRLNTLDEILAGYDSLWLKNWHDDIIISRKEMAADHYRASGKKMLETYYQRHAPFNRDITLGTEMWVTFSLDEANKYRLRGIIDRLSLTPDGVHHINDYKTSAHLPGQEEVDNDRQLALYQIGVQKKWPDIKDVKLVWHYLAFDRELVSARHPAEKLARLAVDTIKLIDEIEATEEFSPRESLLCDWCEYPDLCPNRKHFFTLEALPANEYLKEPGVVLVNQYAKLREEARKIDEETALVKEALVEYARRAGVTAIRGSDRQVRVKFDEKLKFPGRKEPGRKELDETIMEAGKWQEVSQLDTTALARAIQEELWDIKLIEKVVKHGSLEETSAVYLSKLKDDEK
ncbi:MAG: PD-(D/E)XK nuclease family protein [Chloroflexi bacterium]|nr:PD-(D/E)XK nuclease family protein [Chloroflexota bacterium]